MPLYSFSNQKGKIQDFFFSMNSAPSLGSEIEIEGVCWTRVILEPPGGIVSTISNINPRNAKEFAEVTGKKSGTVGDLWNLSEELSARRAEKDGKDFIGEKDAAQKKEKFEARKARNKARKIESQKIVEQKKKLEKK